MRRIDQNYESEITDKIVKSAMPRARVERHTKDVETLTPHQHTLYEIIEEHEEISKSMVKRVSTTDSRSASATNAD